MSGLMNDILNIIHILLEFMIALFQGYFLQRFYEAFLEKRFSTMPFYKGIVTLSYGALKSVINIIFPSQYDPVRIIGKLLLHIILLLLLAIFFYKAFKMITAFLVITFISVSEISFFIAYMVMMFGNFLMDLWVYLIQKAYIQPLTFEWIYKITIITFFILCYAAFVILLYISLKKIMCYFKEKEYPVNRTELFFLLLPGVVGLLICALLRIIMVTVENGIAKLLYHQFPVLMFVVPAILILSLLSILYGIKLFQDLLSLNRERNSRVILEKQIDNMQDHITEIEHIYSGIRSMKHDMKNTLAVIMQLALEEKKTENTELKNYLSELQKSFDRLESRFKTGNAVVDILLNMKYHEIIRTIPDLCFYVDRLLFPASLNIQSYDIGVILGNALDNAIEACRNLKTESPDENIFIRLSSFQKGKFFFIEIENSFNGKLIRKKQSEFPVTSKSNKQAHGIGFANIKSTAEKYHGAVDWSVHDKTFLFSIMMKNERGNEVEY